MTLQRSTHLQTFAQGIPVVLEVSHLKHFDIDMLYSLIEIWLYKNCQSLWTLEQIEENRVEDHKPHTYIRIVFNDIREAMYFKLSPGYTHNKLELPLFLLV